VDSVELMVATKELAFQNVEKGKRAAELIIANKELIFQNKEKEKRAAELIIANKELAFQNEEKEKRAEELIIANKELAFQNEEKGKRASELIIANTELIFQNKEKEKRAAELIIANAELAFQNEEKEKRASELIIANKELIYQNTEKEKRASELIVANTELIFQNAEKEKRAEELIITNREHDKQQALFTFIVNSSEDAIISKNPDGIITTWNHGAEKVLGYSAEEIIGKNISIIVPPNLQNEENEILKKNSNGEMVNHFETERMRKDGRIIYVSLTLSPIKDSDGNIIGASKILRDITRRKKAEEQFSENLKQLERSNKELESFSYSVSHDLRTPLRAIHGYARMLEDSYNSILDENGKRILGEVEHNAKKMGMLIDDLLAFSRLGREAVKKSTVNMNELTEAVLLELKQSVPHRAEVKLNNLLPVRADYALMEHVMTNLLSNAIKYSSKKEKPVIEITSKIENGEVVYSIKDNGVGFDMKYAHKLFGVFQRLHTTKEFPGTGVGLAIVQRIIHKHEGKIWVDGKLGEGATFFFSLPG
jgi:PAS domain S-box-containing protein